ncbi:hypothetical protein PTKIN_Ptkin09bG0240700 [Pterospermum kingtungense]
MQMQLSAHKVLNPNDFSTEFSNDTISPLPHSPPVNINVVNETDKAVTEKELEVETELDSCLGRYIFVHDLPSRFNKDLIENCGLITWGTDKNVCPYLENLGFGPQIENPENVLLNSSWPEYHNSIRGKIIDQCLASKNQCKLMDCKYGATNCDNPVNVMRVFRSSIFCLQPPGDSYTRRSIFDSILAGCIPVFFHPDGDDYKYTFSPYGGGI